MLTDRFPTLPALILLVTFAVSASLPVTANSGEMTAEKGLIPWEVIDVNMQMSLAAYRKGDHQTAYMLAATAYLDGFELVEDRLKEVDADLMKTIEQGMEQVRNLMRQDAALQVVENQNAFVQNLLSQARDALDAAAGGSR